MRQWVTTGAATIGAGVLAERAGVPVAWLVGPMLAALALALVGRGAAIPPPVAFGAAQAAIGVALSGSVTRDSLAPLTAHWGPVLVVVGVVFALSLGSGLALARVGGLDRATALLGAIPGGASGMVAMSDDLGADARIVAVMQYVRLVLVVLSASLLASWLAPPAEGLAMVVPSPGGDGPIGWGVSIVTAVAGAWLGRRFRMPAGALVGPLVVGAAFGAAGVAHGAWPPGVLAAAYAVLGVRVGASFDPAALRRVGRLMPLVLGFVGVLIVACALLGWGFARATGLDGLTAYLATTPGGIDAATIAALETGANAPVVLAVQLVRFLVMVIAGPPTVRWLVRRQAD